MSKIVRMAVVGCGSVSQRGLLPHLTQDDVKDRVKLAATMDVVAERAKRCKEKFGAEEWYDDYDEMLAKADVDAVTIATPIQLHYEQAMKAIAAGVHLHLNKTMTATFEQANKLVEAAKKKNVKVVASPGDRAQLQSTRLVKKYIMEGTIGKVFWVVVGSAGFGHELEPFRKAEDILTNVDPSWYYGHGAGPMRDRTVYELHRITSILGPAKRVAGFSGIALKERRFKDKIIKVEEEDNTTLLLDWGDATFGMIYGSECPIMIRSINKFPGILGPFITGSEGEIAMGYNSVEVFSGKVSGGYQVTNTERTLPYVEGIHYKMDEFWVYNDIMHLVDCIINDKTPIVVDNIVSVEHARHVIEIIDKGYVASRTGKTQTLTSTF